MPRLGIWAGAEANFDIGILYQAGVPKEAIDRLTAELVKSGLKVETHERPLGVYAVFEWAAPTLIVAYLAKPYFEAFLKEAGKESCFALKTGLLGLFDRIFRAKPQTQENQRSLIFSVQIRDHQERSLKCIFPEGVSQEQYGLILDHLQELLLEDAKMGNGTLDNMLSAVSGFGGSYFIEYSLTQNMWVAIDIKQEIQQRTSKKH